MLPAIVAMRMFKPEIESALKTLALISLVALVLVPIDRKSVV